MAMSSEDIIHHMACDLSQWICHVVPAWPFPGQPADAYTDTVYAVFGDEPNEETVLQCVRSGQATTRLHQCLNREWQTDVVTEDTAHQLLLRMIVNNFGPDALDS